MAYHHLHVSITWSHKRDTQHYTCRRDIYPQSTCSFLFIPDL